jgi:hypothetical protein
VQSELFKLITNLIITTMTTNYKIENNVIDTNSTWFVSNGCTFWYDPTGEFDINSDSCEHIAVKNYISNAQGIASSLEKAIEQAKNIGIQFFTEEECQQ